MRESLRRLFLDTDYDDQELNEFAASIARAQYSVHGVEDILFNEVYPVCGPNLQDPVGESMGFPISWLEEQIVALPDRRPGRFRG